MQTATRTESPEEHIAHLLDLGRQIGQALGPNPIRPKDLYDDQTGLAA